LFIFQQLKIINNSETYAFTNIGPNGITFILRCVSSPVGIPLSGSRKQ
jgi:hypothetical protein